MVAPKRGRGAKAANVKATPAAEEQAPAEELATDENNGAGEPAEVSGDAAADTAEPAAAPAEAEAGEAAPEPQPEEKVEPGKLLVDNLPSSLLFEYQEKLKELFCKYGEVSSVKRGPIVVSELTTTPTLSAIVEFKNKDSLDKAVAEDGALVSGSRIRVEVQPSTVDTTVLVGVPVEATNDYVRLLFGECGEVAQVQEFSKTKYKILRVTYTQKESMEKALKLDRELRINGFLVTVTKYREDDEQRAVAHNNKNTNKRQHQAPQNRNQAPPMQHTAPVARNNFRGRGGFVPSAPVPYRGRGARGGAGFVGRGGTFVRGGGGYRGRGAINTFMGRGGGFMGRGGYMMDGQRPNKRLRQE